MVAQSPEAGVHVLNARAFRIELEFRNLEMLVFSEQTYSTKSHRKSQIHFDSCEVAPYMSQSMLWFRKVLENKLNHNML